MNLWFHQIPNGLLSANVHLMSIIISSYKCSNMIKEKEPKMFMDTFATIINCVVCTCWKIITAIFIYNFYKSLQDIRAMIHATVRDVQEFLWHHLEKDMENLGKTLNLNWDDVAIVVHLILNNSVQPPTGLWENS